MDDSLQVLLVDDDEDEYFLLKEMIRRAPQLGILKNITLDWSPSYEKALEALAACSYDLFLVDYYLGTCSGLDFLQDVAESGCRAPVILLTGLGRYEIDMAAMQLGAADFLVKNELTPSLLERSIRYAIERNQVERDLARLVQERTRALALLEKQTRELNELHNATASLLKTLDLNALMGQILDAAQGAVDASDQSCLHLAEKPESALNQLSEVQFSDPRIRMIDFEKTPQHPLRFVCDGEPLLVNDAQAGQFPERNPSGSTNPVPVRSFISAPLILGKDTYGALSLISKHPDAFGESELHLLISFAATATTAIHNAILHAEVENLAITDPLTGRLNRRALLDQGQREFERFLRFGHSLSAIMFDIDHFKEINDTYGHAVGDRVLLAVVERCSALIRHVDILGRYGGDEFIIFLPEADQNRVYNIAERIRSSVVDSPVKTDSGLIPVSISLGVAQAERSAADLAVLIRCADAALYEAKQNGRNSIRKAAFPACAESPNPLVSL